MSSADSGEGNETLQPLTLEESEAPPIAAEGGGMLFSDDVPSLASRVQFLETVFRLLIKDFKFQDFMRELLMAVMGAVKCEAGSILEVDYREMKIFFRAAAGRVSDKIVRFLIPMGQGIVGHVCESKQPFVVDNVPENKIHLKSIQDAVGFDTRNMIAIPILIRGRVFGVLELLNRVGEDNFTEADKELLTKLCEVVGQAVEIRLMLHWASTERRAA